MNYRELAKDLLKRKKQLEAAVKSLELQKQQLIAAQAGCKSPTYDNAIHAIGISDGQDRLAAMADRIFDCEYRSKVVERELQMIDIGMSVLDDYQRELLTEFFIDGKKGAADDLCERFYRERSCLYKDRAKAIDSFTLAVFGTVK